MFDLALLARSVHTPGMAQLVNCECGVPDDDLIEERILVLHCDAHTLVWQFSDLRLQQILLAGRAEPVAGRPVALRFDAALYADDVRRMHAQARALHAELAVEAIAPGDAWFAEQVVASDGTGKADAWQPPSSEQGSCHDPAACETSP